MIAPFPPSLPHFKGYLPFKLFSLATMISFPRSLQCLSLVVLVMLSTTNAFSSSRPSCSISTRSKPTNNNHSVLPRLLSSSSRIFSSDNNSNNNSSNEDRLRQLGYSDDEIRRSTAPPQQQPRQELKVRVDLVDDVDPVTLTAIGFGLIALNFLVFANLGDGGISGIVATIINSF